MGHCLQGSATRPEEVSQDNPLAAKDRRAKAGSPPDGVLDSSLMVDH